MRITEENAFHYTTWTGDQNVDFRVPIPDPFIHHRTVTTFGWGDRIRILFGKKWDQTVIIGADPDVASAVMRLERDGDEIVLPVLNEPTSQCARPSGGES